MNYEIRKNITSCDASLDFLKGIESYIHKQADTISNDQKQYLENKIKNTEKHIGALEKYINDSQHAKDSSSVVSEQEEINTLKAQINDLKKELPYSFSIELEDKYGKQIINTFNETPWSTLDNDVHTIIIRARSNSFKDDFRLYASYSKEQNASYILVEISGESSKEKALGITHELEKRAKEHYSYNKKFYGWHNNIIYGLLGLGPNGYIFLDGEAIRIYYFGYSIFVILCAAYFILKFMSPYCVLPTAKNNRYGRFKKWLLGITTAIIISLSMFAFNNSLLSTEDNNQTKSIKINNIQNIGVR